MLNLALILIIIAISLIFLELIFPTFGICGLLAFVCILTSFYILLSSVRGGAIIIAVLIALIISLTVFTIWFLKRKNFHKKLVLNETLDTYFDNIKLDGFAGKKGTAKTALRPFGKADIDGALIEVISEETYINKDEKIIITKVIDNKIYVKPEKINL